MASKKKNTRRSVRKSSRNISVLEENTRIGQRVVSREGNSSGQLLSPSACDSDLVARRLEFRLAYANSNAIWDARRTELCRTLWHAEGLEFRDVGYILLEQGWMESWRARCFVLQVVERKKRAGVRPSVPVNCGKALGSPGRCLRCIVTVFLNLDPNVACVAFEFGAATRAGGQVSHN